MSDTCPTVARYNNESIEVMASDSPKQIHYYTAEFPKITTWFGTVKDCINAAITGRWSGN